MPSSGDQARSSVAINPNAYAATIDVPPPALHRTGPAAGTDLSCPCVELVAGSRPGLAGETQVLLRTRLRAVALLLLFAFALFFVRNLFIVIEDSILWRCHIALIFVYVGALGILWFRQAMPLWGLRAIELALFGLTILFFALLGYRSLLRNAEAADPVQTVATVKNAVIDVFALIILYGLFIPNTWRRAAAVVIPMGVLPLLTSTAVHLIHPEVLTFTSGVASFELVTDNLMIMLVGVVAAIYGTHVINRLRCEVHAARRFGQYQLRECLGRGGMGEVYLAEHQLLKRPCALKLIHAEAAGDARALARFEREVKATAGLSHPNTIEVYDYGRTEDGTFYYVMEYLTGLSLAELVARHGPLPPGRAIYLLRQVCGALTEAHGAGLIHRDIKPANIFAARRGGLWDFAKLLDFGLVKPTRGLSIGPELSADGSISGSPLYMAPEQAVGDRPVDARSDLYALGAVGYFLLTGRPPFEGQSAVAVMVAHARDPITPPTALRPDIPADLEGVLLRCLSKDPADRYPDAESLELALDGCAAAADWDARTAARWWRDRESA